MIKGELKGCDGSIGANAARYVARLKTTEEVACPVLTSAFAEPITTPVSLLVKWAPAETGSSHGALTMPLSEVSGGLGEVPGAGVRGTIEGGPFAKPVSIFAASVTESFAGGPACGATKKAKVKKGTFTSTPVEIGRE